MTTTGESILTVKCDRSQRETSLTINTLDKYPLLKTSSFLPVTYVWHTVALQKERTEIIIIKMKTSKH